MISIIYFILATISFIAATFTHGLHQTDFYIFFALYLILNRLEQ